MRIPAFALIGLLVACAPPEGAPEPTPAAPVEPTPAEPTPPQPTKAEEAGWQRGADAPLPLTEVAAAAFAGEIWVAGGFDGTGAAVSAVQIYDPTFDTWSKGPALPEAVHHAALVATADGLLLVGGYVGSGFGQPTAAAHRLDPATGAWEEAPALPAPRAAGAAAWDGSRVMYGGGVGPEGLSGDVLAFDGDTWTMVGALAEPREHLAAASDGEGRVWFLAGRTGGLDTNLTAVDLAEGEDVRRIGDVPTARGGLGGFWHPSAGACAVGGEAPDRTFADVECVDGAGEVTVLPPLEQPRHGLGVVATEGFAYVLLGGPEPALTVSGVVEMLALD